MEDVQDAYRWVREVGPEAFGVDPDRVGVAGASAGAHLALLTGYLLQPRPRALVSFYGYGDIVGPWSSRPDSFYSQFATVTAEEAYRPIGREVLTYDMSDDRYPYYVYLRQQGRWPHEVVGRDPDTEPESFVRWCPVQNVDPAYPPTLLVHGDADKAVPYEQSVMMAEALERAGVVHELITIPGGGHGFDQQWGAEGQRAIERAVAFLREHVQRRDTEGAAPAGAYG
jgi:acetyl esterase/lipase